MDKAFEMSRALEDYRRFPFEAAGSKNSRSSPEAIWEVVTQIGGENRYFALNGLWAAREWIDAAFGGPGRERARPDGPLRPGDRVDSWRVLIADAPELLALEFGMKAPGRGVLEFRIAPLPGGARLTATAWWDPDGIAGLLYWRAMQPAHLLLFSRLTAEICRRAEADHHTGAPAALPSTA